MTLCQQLAHVLDTLQEARDGDTPYVRESALQKAIAWVARLLNDEDAREEAERLTPQHSGLDLLDENGVVLHRGLHADELDCDIAPKLEIGVYFVYIEAELVSTIIITGTGSRYSVGRHGVSKKFPNSAAMRFTKFPWLARNKQLHAEGSQ